MASLQQYLLSRVSQECAETAQAFSKLFDYGLYHRHPVTKELAISKASQEVNDILGTIDLLQEIGVELFGIGNPEKRNAKKLKIFRNMQLSIDERCLILSNEELEKLNAMFPEERPLKQAPPPELEDVEETIRSLHMSHPELFARDIHLDMLLEIARVKNAPLPSEEGSWQQRMQANPPHINSRPAKMLIGIEDTNARESQWAELQRMAPEFFGEDGTIDLLKISIACRLLENKKKFAGTVPHEDGTISTVKTDGGIVTTL